jgi:hypothetical protein
MSEEKDPEEFLRSLLQETLKAEPFIKLRYIKICLNSFRGFYVFLSQLWARMLPLPVNC